MKKHLLLSFLVFVLFLQAGIAQTYIWGGPGDKNSEFNGGLNDWTTVSIHPNDKALWEWRSNGKPDKGAYTKSYPAIASASVANGAAIFDSDFLTTNGISGGEGGLALAPQVSELISPTFSCANRQSVFLRFNSYIRNFSTKVFYSTSIDGGQTWADNEQIHSRINLYEFTLPHNIELIDISSKVAGYSNVKIKFTWGTQEDGDFYFWLIDDVYIMENPGPDVVIDGAWYPSTWYSLPRDFVDQDSMSFLSYVINRGSQNVTNAKGKVTLKNLNKNITYFKDSVTFDLEAGDTMRLDFKSFMPSITMDTGVYGAIYEVYSNEFAVPSSGKFFQQVFKLNPNLVVDNQSFSNKITTSDTRQGNSVTWMDGSSRNCAVLNYYRTPNWVENSNFSVYAQSGTFKNGGGPKDFTTRTYLFSVSDTVNNQFYNFDFSQGLGVDNNEATQLEFLGYGYEEFTGYSNWTIGTVPLYNLDDEDNVKLVPNKKYLLGFYWTKENKVFTVWDNWGTYGYNSSFQRYYDGGKDFQDALDQRVSFLYLDDGASHRFYTLGQYGSWVMDLNLKVGTVSTEINQLPENSFSILNNPTINDLEINISLEKMVDKASIAIYNLNGSLIHLRNLDNLQNSSQSFYMGNVPQGEYIITLITKEQLLSKKFIVAK